MGTHGHPVTRRLRAKGALALLLGSFVCLPLAVSGGQAVPKATPADSDLVAAHIVARSFKGIQFSKADSLLAARAMKREFQDFLKINGAVGDEALLQIDALYARRDAALLALLRSAADSARYLSNTAPFTPPRKKTSASR